MPVAQRPHRRYMIIAGVSLMLLGVGSIEYPIFVNFWLPMR